MQVWNLLHAARWKCRTQKSRQKSPSGHHRANLSGYIFATKEHIDTGKNLLSSDMSSACPHNMVKFGLLTAEIHPVVWGTPANFNGFRVLAALLHGIVVGVSQTAALNRGRHLCLAVRPSRWALAHILVRLWILPFKYSSHHWSAIRMKYIYIESWLPYHGNDLCSAVSINRSLFIDDYRKKKVHHFFLLKLNILHDVAKIRVWSRVICCVCRLDRLKKMEHFHVFYQTKACDVFCFREKLFDLVMTSSNWPPKPSMVIPSDL